MRVYLDTNVIIDFLNPAREQHKHSRKLIQSLIANKYEIIISEDMLSTVFYINNEKRITLDFFNSIQDSWMISSFGKNVIKDSIDLSIKNNIDFEDVLQCLCAKKNNCDALITNDNYFYDCGLKIKTASEFLND
jgi:predicted nucleic acid-binding protein